jgi:hypothetical protein
MDKPKAVTMPPHMPKQCGEPKKPAASAANNNESESIKKIPH